jgi:glycosyltransferase involved in cell wall biosynthesis
VRKLTILNVAYPFAPVGPDAVGGAEQVLSMLDAALAAAGHRSLVIACDGSAVCGELIPVPLEAGVLDDAARHRAWARQRRAIAGALARWPVDVVHLHGVDFHAYLPAGVPTLVTLHLPPSWYPAEALRTRRPDLRFNCVSAAQQATLHEPIALTPPIANGVPVEALNARHARRRFALMLGRICPEKGIHLGLDAASRAGIPAVVAGQVYCYEAHERYFRDEVQARLGARARFIGPLDFSRKRRFLTAAGLAPETASLVAMEAAACGTPVVAFASGALMETVEHGVTGFLVRDVKDMADAICECDRIDSKTCRAVARRRFSVERMTARYLAAYRELADGKFRAAS